MPAYRTYIIGRADHFWGAEDLECADDQEAIRKVQDTMDGRDVEVWERGRFIVRLCPRAFQHLTRLGTRAKSLERSWEEKPWSNK
jgi:hypothetical protein